MNSKDLEQRLIINLSLERYMSSLIFFGKDPCLSAFPVEWLLVYSSFIEKKKKRISTNMIELLLYSEIFHSLIGL